MLFNSPEFFFFFTAVTVLYFLMPHRFRNLFLLASGYVFYMAWKPGYILLIVGTSLVDFFCARRIEETEVPRRRSFFLALSIGVNLGALLFFKYSLFLAVNAVGFANLFGAGLNAPVWDIVLPIGISFYVFQTMSATIDVYRRKVPAERNPIDFFLYVSFFPTLIAGPIERAGELMPQLKKVRTFDFARLGDGLVLIFFGLFMKMALADNLAPYVDRVYGDLSPAMHGLPFLLAAYAYFLQIYFDFSGYSAIAVGAAKILGFDIAPNFRAPFLSRSVAEFWQRWHTSLSAWFRDYAFTPVYLRLQRWNWFQNLKGERRHLALFFAALLLTDVLLGFWHGADWGFGLFGLYHAVMVSGYYAFRRSWNRLPDPLQLFLTFQIVIVSGIFFRLRNLQDIGYVFRHLFTGSALEVGAVLASCVALWLADKFHRRSVPIALSLRASRTVHVMALFLWIYATLFLAFNRDAFTTRPPNEFIYFQF